MPSRPQFEQRCLLPHQPELETTLLQCPQEKQLYDVLMGDLKSSPCLKRNYREPVYLPALHFAAVIDSAFSGAVFSSLFLPQKSLMRLLLNHTFHFCSVTIHPDFNVNGSHLHPCNFLRTMIEILDFLFYFLLQILVFPFFSLLPAT